MQTIKQLLAVVLIATTLFTSCSKNGGGGNNGNTTTRNIKTSSYTRLNSSVKSVEYCYYTNNNLTQVFSVSSDTLNNPTVLDTFSIQTYTYNTSNQVVTYKYQQVSTNYYATKMYVYDNQGRIIVDSLIAFNWDGNHPYSYKDTLYNLANKKYTYSNNMTTSITYCDSKLLGNNKVWEYDTNYISNNSITQINTLGNYNGSWSNYYQIKYNYTTIPNKLNFLNYYRNIPFLPSSRTTTTYNLIPPMSSATSTATYQYTLDSLGYPIKQIDIESDSNYSNIQIYTYY